MKVRLDILYTVGLWIVLSVIVAFGLNTVWGLFLPVFMLGAGYILYVLVVTVIRAVRRVNEDARKDKR